MKTEFIRLYTEEELHRRMRQTIALLKRIREEVADIHFCDFRALIDMWVQYESTRFIVAESLLLEDRYDRSVLFGLFIGTAVDDDYSDELKDEESLHNGLVTMQFLYDRIQWRLNYNAYDLDLNLCQHKRLLVLVLAADIMRHFTRENYDREQMMEILDYLNYTYLADTDWDDVAYEEVQQYALAQKFHQADLMDQLVTALDLEEDK